MVKLLFIAEPTGTVAWHDPTGRMVVWSWIIGAAVAGLCSSLAWGLVDAGAGGVGLAILADSRIGALISAIVPAILTWRWCRTSLLGGMPSIGGRRESAIGRD